MKTYVWVQFFDIVLLLLLGLHRERGRLLLLLLVLLTLLLATLQFTLGDLLASDGVSVQVLGLGSRWLCCGLFVSHCCDVRVLLVWAARRDTMPRQTFRFDSPRLRIDCKPREQSFSIRLLGLMLHATSVFFSIHCKHIEHLFHIAARFSRCSVSGTMIVSIHHAYPACDRGLT